MINKLKALCSIVCLFLSTTVLQAQDSGWTVNPHDYQYDMTVYGSLVVDDATVTNFDNYEVAAFVGDECRGIAEVRTQGGYTWLYIRVRSNAASGEKVTFKIYDKTAGKVYNAFETVAFTSNGQEGMPSSPATLTLRRYTLGDVNDDGKITNADIICIRKLIAGDTGANILREAADVNGDNKITNADIISVRRIIAGY